MAITKLSNIGMPKGGGAAHLKNCISYIMNPDKTEGMVGGNAGTTPQEVYQVMIDTKQEWEKEGGRQGYHFVISFPPGEATKEEAYAVINDFCEEYLGEDYDYVFSIHTDQKHMHGHIVFNSVNRMSGYKYRYEKKDWEKYIQPLTDRICEKYGLPPLVYDKNNKIGKSYAAHYAEKEGRPSSEKIIKADIDFVIASSKDWDDFIRQMGKLGYKIRQKKYVTYIPPGFERGRRDSRLGPGYRAEEIKERIKNKGQEQEVEKILSHELSKVYEREIFQYTKTTLTVFQMKKIKNFYQTGHYLEEKNPYAVAWKEVRRNAVHIDQLYEECKYILEHEIKTEKDLLEKQKILIKKEAELFNQRRTLFSVEDKKIFQQYRVLKKRLADVDMIGFVPLSDFYKEPALRVVGQITEATQGFTAEGHFGTWHSIQMQEFHNEKFFQMRHDEFGEQVADIIVNEQGQVIAEDLWHGFSPEAMKLIGEYLLNRSLHEKKEAAYVISGDSGYFMIHETDGGYDYTFYNEDYQELDGGIYDDPEVSLAEAVEDILDDAGISIGNIEETDYEQVEQSIEESEEKELLGYAVQEAKRKLKGGDIRLTSEVYYKEKSLEGRSRADIEETVLSQAQIIVDELGLHNEVELIGARVYGSRSREGLYRPDSDVDVALSYQGPISEDSFFNYLKEDMLYVKEIPIDINPISKTKSGTLPEYLERAEYYLDEKEIEQFAEQIDTFGRLRGDWYVDETMEPEKAVDAITDDILQKKTGYLNDYLKKTIEISGDQEDIKQAKDLLIQMEKLERLSIFDKEPEPIPEVDFYVAECSEFPSLGEYHEGLTIDEAIAVYEKIPGDRKNGIKAIGINLHFPEKHMYSDKCDLLAGGHICKEMLDAVPFYKENRQVRKAVRYLEKHFEKKENLSLIKPKKKQKNYHL